MKKLLSILLVLWAFGQAHAQVTPKGIYPQLLFEKKGWFSDSLTAQRLRLKKVQDSLALRPPAYLLYTRSQADSRFMLTGASVNWTNQVIGKPASFASTIGQIPTLQDSLNAKLNKLDYQILAAAASAGAYSKAESNQFFAAKGTTLFQYGITNAYTKLQADSSTFYRSIKWGPSAVRGTGTADDTQAIQSAINSPGTGSAVFFPAGIYLVSATIFVPDFVTVVCSPNAHFILANAYAQTTYLGNDAGYVFVLGNYSQLVGADIDCKGYNTGGCSLIQRTGSSVKGCTVRNWSGVRFGVALVGAIECHVSECTMTDGVHAINAFRSLNCTAHQNYGNRLYSFIYGVAATGMEMNGNVGLNCEDVIFDFEKGWHCHGKNNYAQGGNKGEYAIFDGGIENAGQPTMNDVVFSNSVAYRTYTYQKANPLGTTYQVDSVLADWGACSVHSVAPNATDVGFENMTIYVERGSAFKFEQLTDKSNRYVFFRGNTVRSKALFLDMLDSDGVHIENNTFEGLPGSESLTNVVRDAHGLVMEGNKFRYTNPKTGGYAINLLTLSNFATAQQLIARNSFYNCNSRALQVDHYQNAGLLTLLQANSFSTDYQPNGGLNITSNGPAVVRDQPLKLLLADGVTNLSNIAGLDNSRSGPAKAVGNILVARSNYNGLVANVGWASATGVGVTTLVPANGLSLTTSGGNLTINNSTGVAIYGFLDLTVNTINN